MMDSILTSKVLPRALVLAASALLLFGACRSRLAAPFPPDHGDNSVPLPGGTLSLASATDLRSLDPALAADAVAQPILLLLFDGLVDYDLQGAFIPSLASRWELADQGLTYRFWLRPGVRFHDGSELTAHDIARSIQRMLHPATPSPFKGFYASLQDVVVEGLYLVAMHLREPDTTFLHVLAQPAARPVCPDALDRSRDTWVPCGTGPFRLQHWERGVALRLVRHDAYFRPGLPHLDAISYRFNFHPVTQRLAFEAGELDLLHDLTQADLTRFRSDPRWIPLGAAEVAHTVVGESLNTELPPFDSVEVRRAVAAAIDREQYRLLKPGQLVAANQPVPPGVPGHEPNLVGQTYNLDAALEHMKRAGYPYDPSSQQGGYPHPIPYLSSHEGLSETTAQLLQQQLAKIGLRLQLKVASWPAFLAATHRRRTVAASPQGWSLDFPDASDFLGPLFGSAAIQDDDSTNTSFFRHTGLDDLLVRARRELDATRRRALFAEASAIVCDEAPWAFTYYYRSYEVRQGYVRGYVPHPIWTSHVAEAWIDRSDRRLPRR